MKVTFDALHYALNAAINLPNIPEPERYQITDKCPECNQVPDPFDPDDGHLIVDLLTIGDGTLIDATDNGHAVLIACEGYYVVNPVWAGMPMDNWSPSAEGLPAWDGKGQNPYDA